MADLAAAADEDELLLLSEQHDVASSEMTPWRVGCCSDAWTEEAWEDWYMVRRTLDERLKNLADARERLAMAVGGAS
jgi:hypothetical protein